MLIIGLVYLLLGSVIKIMMWRDRALYSRATDRIGSYFHIIGSFNVSVYLAGEIWPFFDVYRIFLGGGSILLFGILVLAELHQLKRRVQEDD